MLSVSVSLLYLSVSVVYPSVPVVYLWCFPMYLSVFLVYPSVSPLYLSVYLVYLSVSQCISSVSQGHNSRISDAPVYLSCLILTERQKKTKRDQTAIQGGRELPNIDRPGSSIDFQHFL